MARPLVTLHFAQSLDGRLGLGPERPRTHLSSEEGLAFAHRARHEHDAVLIGIETLLHDDPRLTARGDGASQPLRVVLDSELRSPPAARLLAEVGRAAGRAMVFGTSERACPTRRARLEAAGADVRLVGGDADGRVSLLEMLVTLGERGVKRLLVEGGSKVLSSFLRARLADRARVEVAPYFLGSPGTPALGELGIGSLDEAPRLEQHELEHWGKSLCLHGNIVYPAREA